jgi:hypothetical protein
MISSFQGFPLCTHHLPHACYIHRHLSLLHCSILITLREMFKLLSSSYVTAAPRQLIYRNAVSAAKCPSQVPYARNYTKTACGSDGSELPACFYWFLGWIALPPLKIKATNSSETSVFLRVTPQQNPEVSSTLLKLGPTCRFLVWVLVWFNLGP